MNADEAIAEVLGSSSDRLLRFAFQLCHDRATSEDLVQTALEQVYRRWQVRGVAEWPEAYVRRAVLNTFLARGRRAASREVLLPSPPERPGVDETNAIVERDPLWRALELLPKRQRAALVLRYYEDLPDSEIAQLLGCRQATVRSLIARGLAGLRTVGAGADEPSEVNPR